ncbi:hypothetical protein BJX76DRAFT_356351 [Aspergillus varians]
MTVLDDQESANDNRNRNLLEEKDYQDSSTSHADDSNNQTKPNRPTSTFLYALDATVVADLQPVIGSAICGAAPSINVMILGRDLQFFKSRTVLLLFASTAAGGACVFVPIYMVPLSFQFTRTDGALDAGVRLLPFVVIMVVFVFVNGNLMARLGHYMPWFLVGGVFTVIGAALMYIASFPVTQATVEAENIAPAIGFIILAQFVGITIALAIANAILLNPSQDKIQQILPNVPASEIQLAILGVHSDLVQNLESDLKTRVLDAIVDAIAQTYILVIVGGALFATSGVLMGRQKLFGAGTGVVVA